MFDVKVLKSENLGGNVSKYWVAYVYLKFYIDNY